MRSAAAERDAGSADTGGGNVIISAILVLNIRENTSSENVACEPVARASRSIRQE
jgi:hypothetical protein